MAGTVEVAETEVVAKDVPKATNRRGVWQQNGGSVDVLVLAELQKSDAPFANSISYLATSTNHLATSTNIWQSPA